MNEDNKTPEQMLAEQAMTRGTFSFADMIRDRTYPETTVALFLDEAKALLLSDAEARREQLDQAIQVALTLEDKDRLDKAQAEADDLDEEISTLRAEMQAGRYEVTIRGFSMTTRRKLVEQAYEAYPEQFEEVSHPLTGRTERKAVENPERDRLFADLMWHQYIVRISRADGAVLEDMTVEDVGVFREMLPLVTREYVQQAIDKVQVASDWYKGLVNEVF